MGLPLGLAQPSDPGQALLLGCAPCAQQEGWALCFWPYFMSFHEWLPWNHPESWLKFVSQLLASDSGPRAWTSTFNGAPSDFYTLQRLPQSCCAPSPPSSRRGQARLLQGAQLARGSRLPGGKGLRAQAGRELLGG